MLPTRTSSVAETSSLQLLEVQSPSLVFILRPDIYLNRICGIAIKLLRRGFELGIVQQREAISRLFTRTADMAVLVALSSILSDSWGSTLSWNPHLSWHHFPQFTPCRHDVIHPIPIILGINKSRNLIQKNIKIMLPLDIPHIESNEKDFNEIRRRNTQQLIVCDPVGS